MNAIDVTDGSLHWASAPDPALLPGHVRLRVRATAVNRADLLQAAGAYPPPPGKSTILGLEAAGEVTEVAADVTGWAPGDRACALLAGGGYAEQAVMPAGHLLPIPERLSFEQAAALPEVLTTAFLNLWREARLQPRERVLLHAGASGVGTAAVQLCRALGNPCWVTAGSAAKIAACVNLGARGGANRHEADFEDAIVEWSDGAGMDVILDPVGADYLARNLRSLATGGRLVLIGLLGGRAAEIDLGRVLLKRLRVVGSVLRARSDDEKTAILADLRARAWPLVASGDVTPIIDRVLPITEAGAAHAAIASNETVGKVVLTVPR